MWDRGAGSRSTGRFESGAWRRGALLFHFFPERDEARVQFGSQGFFGPAACADDQIDARQLMLMQSERFADDPSDTVTFYTTARSANRNGETETRPTLVVPERSHTEESIAKPSTASVGRIKVRLATQAPLRRESEPWWGRAVAGQGDVVLSTIAFSRTRLGLDCAAEGRPRGSVRLRREQSQDARPDRVAARNKRRGFCHARYGMSFLRPLARRRASTARPFFVAIRARNPCVRARRTLLG